MLSKILEKVACYQLTSYLHSVNILSPSQYAFRSRHCTEDAVLDAVERLVSNIENGLVSSVTTIDLSKAFDSVDHDVLLTKLSWYGVDTRWFGSYLSGREQIVRGGRVTLPMSCGVPQGSIIGPILFILFTNDLSGYLTHGRLISYADDTMHLDCAPPDGPGLDDLKNRLEFTVTQLQSWFSANSLKMNKKKTDFMLVGSKPNLKKTTHFHFDIDESSVHASNKVKILGVIVDSSLSWDAHVTQVVQKCNGILVSLFRFRHYFSVEVRQILIQAYVFPHITYCLCVWGGTGKGQLLRIQKVLNFAARIITGTKKYDHITPALNSLGWPKIETLVARRDAVKVFKALKREGTPAEIRAMFTLRSAVSSRDTRAAVRDDLHLRKRDLTCSQRAFSYRSASAWNRLPSTVRSASTLGAFETAIRDVVR